MAEHRSDGKALTDAKAAQTRRERAARILEAIRLRRVREREGRA